MSNLIDLTGDGDAENPSIASAATPPSPYLPEPLVPTCTPPTPTSTAASVHLRPTYMQHPLIVDQRSSYESNPFDHAQHIAEAFDDPFESVHASVLQKSADALAGSNTPSVRRTVNMATLLQLDSPISGESQATEQRFDGTSPRIDGAVQSVPNIISSTILAGQDNGQTPDRLNTSSRNHSDSDLSVVMKTFKSTASALFNSKSRSGSLDQLVRRNQLLKLSLANAQTATVAASTSFLAEVGASTPIKMDALNRRIRTPTSAGRINNESFDDLLATSPKWIVDSEADDSDMEQLCIPFLKDGHESVPLVKPSAQKSLLSLVDKNSSSCGPSASTAVIDATSQTQYLSSQSTMPSLIEVTADEEGASFCLNASLTRPVTPTVTESNHVDVAAAATEGNENREHLASLLASVRMAIERFDNHSEAKAMLAGLNSALDDNATVTSANHNLPINRHLAVEEQTAPIVRQGTFNLLSPSMSESDLAPGEQDDVEDEENGSVSAEVSPNTTNIASVVEQLGRMDLSRLQNAGPPSTTYIVVMNTPAATGAIPRIQTMTPIIRVDNSYADDDDENSPSNYLRVRSARSASLSSCQKPATVSRAVAAKTDQHHQQAVSQPRTSSVAAVSSSIGGRRSSFSHQLSIGGSASRSDNSRTMRRTLSSSPQLPVTPSKRLTQHSKSPSKLIRSPSKLSSATLRQSLAPRVSHSASRTLSAVATGPPSMLRSSAAVPSISQLKLRTGAATSASTKAGPLRATLPVRAVVAPRLMSTASGTGSVMTTPRRSNATSQSAGRSLQPPSTPRTVPSSGLPRSSNVGYLASATPAGKRISTARLSAATGEHMTSLQRRRSMSEGKNPSTVTSSAAGSSLLATRTAASGIAASGRRLSTLSAAGRNKENLMPK